MNYHAQIIRQHDHTVVASNCYVAKTLGARLNGLLGRSSLEEGQGLLLDPCNSIHTFFMNFTIDAVFLDKNNNIIKCGQYKPWRLSQIKWRAKRVLELPTGSIQTLALAQGQILNEVPKGGIDEM